MSVTFFSADDGRSNSVLDIPALVELKRPPACHPRNGGRSLPIGRLTLAQKQAYPPVCVMSALPPKMSALPAKSGHWSVGLECPLWANSGHIAFDFAAHRRPTLSPVTF